MTVLVDNTHFRETSTTPIAGNETMDMVLIAVRYDLSLDPAKTEKQVKKWMGDLTTVVNHMAKSLQTTRELLTVREAVESESIFLGYIVRSELSPASKAKLSVSRNAVLRYARKFGFSPDSFALLNEWEPVLAILPTEYGAAAIANDAIRRKRYPVDFSDSDFRVWADAALDAGRTYSYVSNAQSGFRTAIRNANLSSRLPQLDVAVRKLPEYRLRTQYMPDSLRTEIAAMIDSRRILANLGEVSMAPATEREIIGHFEEFCGYAVRVCGMEVVGLEPLLNEPFIKQYAFWLRNDRMCKRSTVVGRLSRMVAALKDSPDLKGCDFSWIYSIYRKLRKEPESALKERRRRGYIAFDELAAIPRRMRDERAALCNPSPISLAWRLKDELLLSFLILAQYPPRFVRTAVLGRNIFKGPIPKNGPPFKIPTWAQELLSKDPDTQFWQFRYEAPDGRLFRGLVLCGLVPLLELYLDQYRPLLLGARPDPGNLFLHRSLGPLTSYRLVMHVGALTRRYSKRVTPTSIRNSFAYYWREKHPDQDALLANIQWVQYSTIKMRYDEEFRKQRAARVSRRRHRVT